MPSRIAVQRFDLVPSVIPARRPASETSVQGEPPEMMSTGSTSDQSTAVMSPRFGTPGQWWAMTLHGPGSTSERHTVRAPNAASTAISKPPLIA